MDVVPDMNYVKRNVIMSEANPHKEISIKSRSLKFYDVSGTITVHGER